MKMMFYKENINLDLYERFPSIACRTNVPLCCRIRRISICGKMDIGSLNDIIVITDISKNNIPLCLGNYYHNNFRFLIHKIDKDGKSSEKFWFIIDAMAFEYYGGDILDPYEFLKNASQLTKVHYTSEPNKDQLEEIMLKRLSNLKKRYDEILTSHYPDMIEK